jgi:hypothetical protein
MQPDEMTTSPPLDPPTPPPVTDEGGSLGKRAAKAVVGVVLLGGVLSLPFLVVPWLPRKVFGALPWLPTSARRVNAVLRMLKPQHTQPGNVFVDLGSGDGVAVIEAAKAGMQSFGVELNPTLWLMSLWNARVAGVHGHTAFTCGDLFKHPIGDAHVVMVFGVVPLMPRIAAKLDAEARHGAVVISHKFRLPADTWGRHLHATVDDMLIYRKGDSPLR